MLTRETQTLLRKTRRSARGRDSPTSRRSWLSVTSGHLSPIELVECHIAHGLLPHGALVRVPGRLVVMGVRDQPRDNAQDGERLDLQVRHLRTCDATLGRWMCDGRGRRT